MSMRVLICSGRVIGRFLGARLVLRHPLAAECPGFVEPLDTTMPPTMSIRAPDTPTPPSLRQGRAGASLATSFVYNNRS